MKSFSLLLLILMLAPSRGADIYLTNLTNSVVKAAIETAASGDTVWLPAGSATWSTSMNIAGRRTLRGAGIGQTIITMAGSPTVTTSGNGVARLCHMTIVSGGDPMIKPIGFTNWAFRVDHVLVTNLTANAAIQQEGWNYGVVDSSVFRTAAVADAANAVLIYGDGNGNASTNSPGQTNNCPSYDTIPLSPGSTNMLYIEDNGFYWTTDSGANGAVDAYRGARYAFRFNNVTNTHTGNHGTDSVGTLRGCVWWEVYGNNFRHTSAQQSFSFRGGTGVIVSNTVVQTSGTPQDGARIDHYRSSGTNIYAYYSISGGPATNPISYQPFTSAGIVPSPCCSPYGPTSLTNSVYSGYWGGTNRNEYGYPSYDQIGWGPPSRYMANGVAQTQAPAYQWSNTFNGEIAFDFRNGSNFENSGIYDFVTRSSHIIQLNRDYYDNTPHPTWVPLQRFHPIRIAQNSAPTMTDPSSQGQSVDYGQAFVPIDIIVTDDDDLPTCVLGVSSSNTSFIPNDGIFWNGSLYGTNRTITVNPIAGASGSTTITISITDPYGLSASGYFTLSMEPPQRIFGNTVRVGSIRSP